MKKSLVALLALMSILATSDPLEAKPIRQPLNDSWKFRQAGKTEWLDTQVPNSVHAELFRHGLIPDPFYGTNESELQWIENENWEFERVFDVERDVFYSKHLELTFKGLDTYAEVRLNDSLILTAENMFRSWTIDVKGILLEKGNRLQILLKSVPKTAEADWKALGYELPGGPRTVTRKAQFHYGWDWGPRFVGCGIWQPVELLGWDDYIIENVFYQTVRADEKEAFVVCHYSYRSLIKADVQMFMRNNNDKTKGIEGRSLEIGEHEDSVTITIKNPKLWWCQGLGEPNLYDFTLEIRKGAATTLDKVDTRFGVRTVELVQEPDPKGKSFYLKLNGKPVFCKGANYIPQDIFQSRVTPGHYKKLFDDVVGSNMNMLRVWGGGIYETDVFYQLADARGILIWQDFMFACALYPGNGKFFKNVAAEALQQITRLRNYSSVVLFCGNNENNEAWNNWGWQMQFTEEQRKALWQQYRNIFDELLPIYVENLAPGVPYWESSPSFGRADKRSLTEGDSHYWGVWHDEKPFEEFEKQVPRFMSEYGFQSFPDWQTIQSFSTADEQKLESKTMLLHQKHPRGNALIAEYMKRDYRVPKANFEHFVYVSQLLQAEGMRKAIEAHRRAKPYCMGTLYWQLNDVWQVASWAGRDNFGRWKALQYFVRDAFRPAVVLPRVEDNQLKIQVASDLPTDTTGEIEVRATDFSGKFLYSETISNVRIDAISTVEAASIYLPKILNGNKAAETIVVVSLKMDGKLASERIFYLESPKNLKLPFAKIDVKVEQVTEGYLLKLSSVKLAKNVRLSSPAIDGWFDDNYFDLLPGKPKMVLLRTTQILDSPAEQIKAMSLVETF